MKLRIERDIFLPTMTHGKLVIDDVFFCYTLEDTVREPGIKIYGQTAIPAGVYRVIIDHSNRFGKLMPHLIGVPMFEGIRIHCGNRPKDTEGCILLGRKRLSEHIEGSHDAFDAFFPLLEAAVKTNPVFIDVLSVQSGAAKVAGHPTI